MIFRRRLRIFMSYRRSDSADVAGRIFDRLQLEFGRERVFKDVDSIPFGVDFGRHIRERLADCDVALIVIGPGWSAANKGDGSRRLDDPADFVRIEVEQALRRGIPVVPVLVRDSEMPGEKELPGSLRELRMRNAIKVRSDPDFHRDMDRLIRDMKATKPAPPRSAAPTDPPPISSRPRPSPTPTPRPAEPSKKPIGDEHSAKPPSAPSPSPAPLKLRKAEEKPGGPGSSLRAEDQAGGKPAAAGTEAPKKRPPLPSAGGRVVGPKKGKPPEGDAKAPEEPPSFRFSSAAFGRPVLDTWPSDELLGHRLGRFKPEGPKAEGPKTEKPKEEKSKAEDSPPPKSPGAGPPSPQAPWYPDELKSLVGNYGYFFGPTEEPVLNRRIRLVVRCLIVGLSITLLAVSLYFESVATRELSWIGKVKVALSPSSLGRDAIAGAAICLGLASTRGRLRPPATGAAVAWAVASLYAIYKIVELVSIGRSSVPQNRFIFWMALATTVAAYVPGYLFAVLHLMEPRGPWGRLWPTWGEIFWEPINTSESAMYRWSRRIAAALVGMVILLASHCLA